jgi:uroporphyrin-III C-methyltransferase/NAD(P)H-dependent nitrite reductase small subunit
MPETPDRAWVTVCRRDDLRSDEGVAAVVGDLHVALFRMYDGRIFALDNHDPFSKASVLSRGIVGTQGEVPIVSSPMYKQRFALTDGRCLDDASVTVPTYPVRVLGADVQVEVPVEAGVPVRAGVVVEVGSAQEPRPEPEEDEEERGRVYFVGGGPGAPDLLTIRGWRILQFADVVVVNRRAPHELLKALPDHVRVIDVASTPNHRGMTEYDIDNVLVEQARAGRRVARLLDGDPLMFSRAGEEILICLEAGVPVEVVPGVTSLVAAAAAAGVPLTHRGVSRCVTAISPHWEAGTTVDERVDWKALAEAPGTLAVLMGVGRLGMFSERLMSHGKPGSTPVAVVQAATRVGQQRVLYADLATVAARAAAEGVNAPAVVIAGDVVNVLPERARGLLPPVEEWDR